MVDWFGHNLLCHYCICQSFCSTRSNSHQEVDLECYQTRGKRTVYPRFKDRNQVHYRSTLAVKGPVKAITDSLDGTIERSYF